MEGLKANRSTTEYFLQVGIVYIVVVASLVNLSLGIGSSELWKCLLLTFLGYFLPSPSLIKAIKSDSKTSSPNQSLPDVTAPMPDKNATSL